MPYNDRSIERKNAIKIEQSQYLALVQILNDAHNLDSNDEGADSKVLWQTVLDLCGNLDGLENFNAQCIDHVNEIKDNLNKYFVIDANPDEIFKKLKSIGQVFFPSGWSAKKEGNHATYIELKQTKNTVARARPGSAFYDLKVYNIGAGSQTYNTSIEYEAGSRSRLIPYCCYTTRRLKDEDLKNLIKSITWVYEKDFEVVDLTEDSYYDWINACLLKYFDDFKAEKNAPYRKTQFSGSCTWKSLSSTFPAFFSKDWKQKITLIKILALKRLMTTKTADNVTDERLRVAIEIAQMSLAQRVLKKGNIEFQPLFEEVVREFGTREVDLTPQHTAHDEVQSYIEGFDNQLYFLTTRAPFKDPSPERENKFLDESLIKQSIQYYEDKNIQDTYCLHLLHEISKACSKIIRCTKELTTLSDKISSIISIFFSKTNEETNDSISFLNTDTDTDTDDTYIKKIKRIGFLRPIEHHPNSLEKLAILKFITLYRVFVILYKLNSSKREGFKLKDFDKDSLQKAYNYCLHLLRIFFSKVDILMQENYTYESSSYIDSLLQKIQLEISSIVNVAKPKRKDQFFDIKSTAHPDNKFQLVHDIESLANIARDSMYTDQTCAPYDNLYEYFVNPLTICMNTFFKDKDVYSDFKYTNIENCAINPIKMQKKEFPPITLDPLSEIWKDPFNHDNKPLSTNETLCRINIDTQSKLGKSSQELRHATSLREDGKLNILTLQSYIQFSSGPYLNSTWGEQTPDSDLFLRQRYIALCLVKSLGHSDFINDTNSEDIFDLTKAIDSSISLLIEKNKHKHVTYLLHLMTLLIDYFPHEKFPEISNKIIEKAHIILNKCLEESLNEKITLFGEYFAMCCALSGKCTIKAKKIEKRYSFVYNYFISHINQYYSPEEKILSQSSSETEEKTLSYFDNATHKYVERSRHFTWQHLPKLLKEVAQSSALADKDQVAIFKKMLGIPEEFIIKNFNLQNNVIIFTCNNGALEKTIKIDAYGDIYSPFKFSIKLPNKISNNCTFRKLFNNYSHLSKEIYVLEGKIYFEYGENLFSALRIAKNEYTFVYHQTIQEEKHEFRYYEPDAHSYSELHQIFSDKSIWHADNYSRQRTIMLTLDNTAQVPKNQILKVKNGGRLIDAIAKYDGSEYSLIFPNNDSGHFLLNIGTPSQIYMRRPFLDSESHTKLITEHVACHLNLSFTELDDITCNELPGYKVINNAQVKNWFDSRLNYTRYLILTNNESIKVIIPRTHAVENIDQQACSARYNPVYPELDKMKPSSGDDHYYVYDWENNTLESNSIDAKWFLTYLLLTYDENGRGAMYAANYVKNKLIFSENLSAETKSYIMSIKKLPRNPYSASILASNALPKYLRETHSYIQLHNNIPVVFHYRKKANSEYTKIIITTNALSKVNQQFNVSFSDDTKFDNIKFLEEEEIYNRFPNLGSRNDLDMLATLSILYPSTYESSLGLSYTNIDFLHYYPGIDKQRIVATCFAHAIYNNHKENYQKPSIFLSKSKCTYTGNTTYDVERHIKTFSKNSYSENSYANDCTTLSHKPFVQLKGLIDPNLKINKVDVIDTSENYTFEYECNLKGHISKAIEAISIQRSTPISSTPTRTLKSNINHSEEKTKIWGDIIKLYQPYSTHVISRNYITPHDNIRFLQTLFYDYDNAHKQLGIVNENSFNHIKNLAKGYLWHATNEQYPDTKREFNFDHPHAYALLLLEYRLNIRLRASQINMVNLLCTKQENGSLPKRIVQANMGDGKTTIAGTLSLILAQMKPELSVLILPSKIIEQQGHDIIKQCKKIFNIELIMKKFDREYAKSTAKISDLLTDLQFAQEHKIPVITTAESISCIRLSILESMLDESYAHKNLYKIYNLFSNGSILTDEFDDIYGTGSPVIYCINDKMQYLDRNIIKHIIPILKGYIHICEEQEIDYTKKISPRTYKDSLFDSLIDTLSSKKISHWNDAPPLTIIKKNLRSKIGPIQSETKFSELLDLIKDGSTKTSNIINFFNQIWETATIKDIDSEKEFNEKQFLINKALFIHYFLHQNIQSSISMPAGLIYGLDKTEKSVSRIIIPYNSGKPAKGSRFSDVLLTSTLTVLQALRDGFSQDELNHIVLSHLEECKEYMRDHIENKPGGQLIDIIDPDEFDSFYDGIHTAQRITIEQKLGTLYQALTSNPEGKHYQKVLWHIIECEILPKINYNTGKIKASWASAPKGSGFSGTTHFPARFIDHTCSPEKEIDGQTIYKLQDMKCSFYSEKLLSNENLKKFIQDNICLRAIIDAGSLIQTASMIAYVNELKDTIFENDCEAIFFFEDNKFFALKKEGKAPIHLDSFEEKSIRSKVGVDADKRFWFYGPGQTRGVDAILKSDCKVLVLGRKECSLADWLQAAMRARGLGKGQTCDFVLEDDLVENYDLHESDLKLFRKDNQPFQVEDWWKRTIDTDIKRDSQLMIHEAADLIENVYQSVLFEKLNLTIAPKERKKIIQDFFLSESATPLMQIKLDKQQRNSKQALEEFAEKLEKKYQPHLKKYQPHLGQTSIKNLKNKVDDILVKVKGHISEKVIVVENIRTPHGEISPVKIQEKTKEKKQQKHIEKNFYAGRSLNAHRPTTILHAKPIKECGFGDIHPMMMCSLNYFGVAYSRTIKTWHRVTHIMITKEQTSSSNDLPAYPFILLTAEDIELFRAGAIYSDLKNSNPSIVNLNDLYDTEYSKIIPSVDNEINLDRKKAIIMTMLISGNIGWLNELNKKEVLKNDSSSMQSVLLTHFKHTNCKEIRNFIEKIRQAYPQSSEQLNNIFNSNVHQTNTAAKIIQNMFLKKMRIVTAHKHQPEQTNHSNKNAATAQVKIKNFFQSKQSRQLHLQKIDRELSQSNNLVHDIVGKITRVKNLSLYLWVFTSVLALANLMFNFSLLPKAIFITSMLSCFMMIRDFILQNHIKSYIQRTKNNFTHRSNCMNIYSFRFMNNKDLNTVSKLSPTLFLVKCAKALSIIALLAISLSHIFSRINPLFLLITPLFTLILNHIERRATTKQYNNWNRRYKQSINEKYKVNIPSPITEKSYNMILKSFHPYLYLFQNNKMPNANPTNFSSIILSINEAIPKLPDDENAQKLIFEGLAQIIENGWSLDLFDKKNCLVLYDKQQLLNHLTKFLLNKDMHEEQQFKQLFTLLRFAKHHDICFDPVMHDALCKRFPVTRTIKKACKKTILDHLNKGSNYEITSQDIQNILTQDNLEQTILAACTVYLQTTDLSLNTYQSQPLTLQLIKKRISKFYINTGTSIRDLYNLFKHFGLITIKKVKTNIAYPIATLHSLTHPRKKPNRKTIFKQLSPKITIQSSYNSHSQLYQKQNTSVTLEHLIISEQLDQQRQLVLNQCFEGKNINYDQSFVNVISQLREQRFDKLYPKKLQRYFRECQQKIPVECYYETIKDLPTVITKCEEHLIAQLKSNKASGYHARVFPLKDLWKNELLKNILLQTHICNTILIYNEEQIPKNPYISTDDFFNHYRSNYSSTFKDQLTNDATSNPENLHVIMTKNTFIKVTQELIRLIALSRHETSKSKSKLIASFGSQNNIHLSTDINEGQESVSFDFTSKKCIVEINFLRNLKQKLSEKFISKSQASQISQSIGQWRQEMLAPSEQRSPSNLNINEDTSNIESKRLFKNRTINSTLLDTYLSELMSLTDLKDQLSLDDAQLSLDVQGGKPQIIVQDGVDKNIDQDIYKNVLKSFDSETFKDTPIELGSFIKHSEKNRSVLLADIDYEIDLWQSLLQLKEQLIYSPRPIQDILDNISQDAKHTIDIKNTTKI